MKLTLLILSLTVWVSNGAPLDQSSLIDKLLENSNPKENDVMEYDSKTPEESTTVRTDEDAPLVSVEPLVAIKFPDEVKNRNETSERTEDDQPTTEASVSSTSQVNKDSKVEVEEHQETGQNKEYFAYNIPMDQTLLNSFTDTEKNEPLNSDVSPSDSVFPSDTVIVELLEEDSAASDEDVLEPIYDTPLDLAGPIENIPEPFIPDAPDSPVEDSDSLDVFIPVEDDQESITPEMDDEIIPEETEPLLELPEGVIILVEDDQESLAAPEDDEVLPEEYPESVIDLSQDVIVPEKDFVKPESMVADTEVVQTFDPIPQVVEYIPEDFPETVIDLSQDTIIPVDDFQDDDLVLSNDGIPIENPGDELDDGIIPVGEEILDPTDDETFDLIDEEISAPIDDSIVPIRETDDESVILPWGSENQEPFELNPLDEELSSFDNIPIEETENDSFDTHPLIINDFPFGNGPGPILDDIPEIPSEVYDHEEPETFISSMDSEPSIIPVMTVFKNDENQNDQIYPVPLEDNDVPKTISEIIDLKQPLMNDENPIVPFEDSLTLLMEQQMNNPIIIPSKPPMKNSFIGQIDHISNIMSLLNSLPQMVGNSKNSHPPMIGTNDGDSGIIIPDEIMNPRNPNPLSGPSPFNYFYGDYDYDYDPFNEDIVRELSDYDDYDSSVPPMVLHEPEEIIPFSGAPFEPEPLFDEMLSKDAPLLDSVDRVDDMNSIPFEEPLVDYPETIDANSGVSTEKPSEDLPLPETQDTPLVEETMSNENKTDNKLILFILERKPIRPPFNLRNPYISKPSPLDYFAEDVGPDEYYSSLYKFDRQRPFSRRPFPFFNPYWGRPFYL